jgi:hypothetical protein
VGGCINDGFVRWVCVYAAPPGFCAGAIFADYFIFLNGLAVTYVTDWLVRMFFWREIDP